MPRDLGKRISIIGSGSSSGKSTLAVALGTKLNLPVIHLDQIYHYSDSWAWRPRDEYMAMHYTEIHKPEWIIEGNYTDSMTERFAQADTIIILSMNRFSSAWRFIKRHYKDKRGKERQIGRIDDSDLKFSWKNLWWIIGPRFLNSYAKKSHKKKKELFAIHKKKLITLHSFKEIDKFLLNYPAAKNLSA